MLRETLDEYLLRLEQIEEKLAYYDRRIEEMAQDERYSEQGKKLGCFKGVATHTALSFAAEVGDFKRFPTAAHFASYLGLTPGEHSSGDSRNTLGITKAGNTYEVYEQIQKLLDSKMRYRKKSLDALMKRIADLLFEKHIPFEIT